MNVRYWLKGDFGSRAASNNTSACTACGVIVYDTETHDQFHDELTRLGFVDVSVA